MTNKINLLPMPAGTKTFVLALDTAAYMGVGDNGFCIYTQDISKALHFHQNFENNKMYFNVVGGAWDGYYLSYSMGDRVGLYRSSSEAHWSLTGDRLTASNNMSVSAVSDWIVLSVIDHLRVSLNWPWADYSNWMEQFQDKDKAIYKTNGSGFGNVPLIQLPIPASHDSGTYGMDDRGRTQNLTIAEQLVLGIRYFDLRPRVNNGVFYIHHGILGSDNLIAQWPAPSPLTDLPCILLEIRNFLLRNKQELVIIKFQNFDAHGSQNFNADDHKHFRQLLNTYLTLISPRPLTNLTLYSIFPPDSASTEGRAIVFYENIGKYAGGPNSNDPTWNNIWPYEAASYQVQSTNYIRVWDPFWEDDDSSLADEGEKNGQIVLTQRWINYHVGKLQFWLYMTSARFLVSQAQMQVLHGTGNSAPGYFSKAEKSAAVNNHLNIDLFSGWMTNTVPPSDPTIPNPSLRPNILSLDFVENGSYCEKILAFFNSLSPSDFDQKYAYAKSFKDSPSFAIGLGQSRYMGRSGGWAVPTTTKSDAMQFSVRFKYDKSNQHYYPYLIIIGGAYNGYFMSVNNNGCIGWYQWSGATGWEAGVKLWSIYRLQYLSPTTGNNYMYANTGWTKAAPITLDWA